MRAEFVEEADAPLSIAERDEVFAQELDPYRRAIRLGDLARETGRDPIAPQRRAHCGARPDPGQQLVFLAWQHAVPPDTIYPVIAAKAGTQGHRLCRLPWAP